MALMVQYFPEVLEVLIVQQALEIQKVLVVLTVQLHLADQQSPGFLMVQ